MINNDLQNITWKTTDRATRTALKTGGELRCLDRQAFATPHMAPIA